MICPKCLTIETEGSLKCRKCGAQLFTGVFQKPVDASAQAQRGEKLDRSASQKTYLIALGVFAASVVALVVVLAILELHIQ